MKTRRKSRFFPYAMLFPTIVVFAVFMIYPILYSLYLSFTEFTGGTYEFVGLRNYIELFNDPVFYKALFNTFFYLIIQVPVMIGLALPIFCSLSSSSRSSSGAGDFSGWQPSFRRLRP